MNFNHYISESAITTHNAFEHANHANQLNNTQSIRSSQQGEAIVKTTMEKQTSTQVHVHLCTLNYRNNYS